MIRLRGSPAHGTNTASERHEDRSCKLLLVGPRQTAKEGGDQSKQRQLAYGRVHVAFSPSGPEMVT